MKKFALGPAILSVFIVAFTILSAPKAYAQIDKHAIFSAMASGNEQQIDAQIEVLEKAAGAESEAYQGALLMKKADVAKGASKKLSLFKSGNKKLEHAISEKTGDAELRLLRLMIQEHAPKMLKYNSDIEKDGAYIKQNFKSLSPEIQKVVIGYTKDSKILKPEDFKAEAQE